MHVYEVRPRKETHDHKGYCWILASLIADAVLVQAAVLLVPSHRARCLSDPEVKAAPLLMGRCISCLLVKSKRVVRLFLLSLLGQFVRVNFPLVSASHPSGPPGFEYCPASLAVLPTGAVLFGLLAVVPIASLVPAC